MRNFFFFIQLGFHYQKELEQENIILFFMQNYISQHIFQTQREKLKIIIT